MESNKTDRTIPAEFTDRVCNILLAFIKGIRGQLFANDPLVPQLDQLEKVIRKAARIRQTTDLGKSIEDFFKGQNLEKDFQNSEKEEAKTIVLEMVNILRDVVGGLGGCDEDFEQFIGNLQEAKNFDDLVSVKDKMIKSTQTIKGRIEKLSQDLKSSNDKIKGLSEKLDKMSNEIYVDSLTKTLNRAAYNVKLGQTIREQKEDDETTILIVCDIDHFKRINDAHGHKMGDKVICSVGNSIQNCLRKSDLIFRYGGEEFVVLLKKCPLEVGKRIAEKIRAAVANDFLVYKKEKLAVTISLGLTNLERNDSEESFFERADKALYSAKKNGRNRFEVFPPGQKKLQN